MDHSTELSVRSSGVSRSWDGDKTGIFLGTIAGVVILDLFTKVLVQRAFHLYEQVQLIGDYLRLTYIHNPGAAFGIHLGPYSRLIFLVLSVVALVALAGMYWVTPARDRVRLIAISLICGGAVGNLVDRIRSTKGVVDFVDVGIGELRWPVFNVADVAVTTGAVLLALSLWREERQEDDAGG
ncbi:MAG: signal peptidase II [Gemmatimonadetes bacterium]|nr:signal peptidase II [Gemmatimonadota bacterium]